MSEVIENMVYYKGGIMFLIEISEKNGRKLYWQLVGCDIEFYSQLAGHIIAYYLFVAAKKQIYGQKSQLYILVYGRNFQNIVKLYWKGLYPLNIYS